MQVNENQSYGTSAGYRDIVEALSEDPGDEPQSDPGDENDAPQQEPSEPEEVDTESEQESGEPEQPPKEEKPKPTAETFAAKTADGKTIQIPKNAKFVKKVHGELVEVSLDEALKHYAFNVPYEKRMAEVAQAKKDAETQKKQVEAMHQQVMRDVQQVAQQLKGAHDAFETGDIDAFLDAYAHLSKKNPFVMRSKLRQHFIPQAKEWLEADEAGRISIDLREQQAYSKSLEDAQKAQQSVQDVTAAQRNYARTQCQQYGVSEQEFVEAEVQVVNDSFGGRMPDLTSATPMQLSKYVDACIYRAKANQQSRSIDGAIAEVSPELKSSNPDAHKRIRELIEPFMGRRDPETIKQAIAAMLKGQPKKQAAQDEEAEPLDDDTPVKARANQTSKSRKSTEDDELEDEDGLPTAYKFFRR